MKALLRQSVLSLCMFLFVPFVVYSQFAQMDEDNVGDIVEGNHRGIVNSEKSLSSFEPLKISGKTRAPLLGLAAI